MDVLGYATSRSLLIEPGEFFFLLRLKHNSNAIITKNANPPTTPPAMAPADDDDPPLGVLAGEDDWLGDVPEVPFPVELS